MNTAGPTDGSSTILDDAYQQLAKHGPVADGRSVSLAAVSKALGMSRNQLYRRWSTSADMALDIASFRSTPANGWHAEVCTDDGGPLADAVRRSLASPRSGDGVLTRASVATWSGSSAHRNLASWERAHLANLASRLRREWGAEVDGAWTDIAIALTALLDGMHLMCAQFAREPGEQIEPALADEITQLAVLIVEFLLHEAEGVDSPIGSPDDELDPPAAVAPLPQRIADALDDGTLHIASDGSRRVIDMGVLARSRGVSERSLYTRWPAPADLNAELFLESVDRTRSAFARTIFDVFQSSLSGSFNHPMPLIARMNAWFMDPERFPEARVHLGITAVLSDPAVLDRIRAGVEAGLEVADMQTAAILQATGFRLRSEFRRRTYTMFIVGMGMGSHRTSATHPQILRRRLRYLGEEYLAAGVGHTAMTRSCCELINAPMDEDIQSVPPIPPALQPIPDSE